MLSQKEVSSKQSDEEVSACRAIILGGSISNENFRNGFYLALITMLLKIAALANVTVDIMNCPEIKLQIPVKNISTMMISLLKSDIVLSSKKRYLLMTSIGSRQRYSFAVMLLATIL